jgi:hypothetical protein
MGTSVSFQFRNEQFCARSRKSRDYAEAYKWYVAQAIPKIDTEIAEKGHFWMETSNGCIAKMIRAAAFCFPVFAHSLGIWLLLLQIPGL